jgi:2-amino-4-hydroxy-6-hydroxymethyldihydropteridine diphosphokinase
MHRALIGLGANLGDRARTIERAVARLEELAGAVVARSRWHESRAVGGPAGQPAFLNGAVVIETSLKPLALLDVLQAIERALGRERLARWDARTIDLDLLLYDELALDTPRLTLPHPRFAIRRFVLQPACEVAPQMIDPGTGWTVERLFEHLSKATAYLAIVGAPGSGKTGLARQLAAATGSRLLLDPCGPSPADNSPSPGWRREIEFLTRRAEVLAPTDWPAPVAAAKPIWTISDFWLGQSLAWASAADGGEPPDAVAAAWSALNQKAVSPKLLAVLRTPGDRLSELIRREVRKTRPAPTLWLAAADFAGAIEQLKAALTAMQ